MDLHGAEAQEVLAAALDEGVASDPSPGSAVRLSPISFDQGVAHLPGSATQERAPTACRGDCRWPCRRRSSTMHVSSDSTDGLLAGRGADEPLRRGVCVHDRGAERLDRGAQRGGERLAGARHERGGDPQPSRRVLAGEPREDRRITEQPGGAQLVQRLDDVLQRLDRRHGGEAVRQAAAARQRIGAAGGVHRRSGADHGDRQPTGRRTSGGLQPGDEPARDRADERDQRRLVEGEDAPHARAAPVAYAMERSWMGTGSSRVLASADSMSARVSASSVRTSSSSAIICAFVITGSARRSVGSTRAGSARSRDAAAPRARRADGRGAGRATSPRAR